jgi:nitrate/nitrite transporter NarK
VTTGLGGPGSMVGFDLARTFNPATRLGSATGIVNVGGFVASLLMMLAIGVLLDLLTPGSGTDYAPAAYQQAMAVQYVGWVLGLVLIWRYRRRARAHLARTQPETYRAMTGQDDAAPSDR